MPVLTNPRWELFAQELAKGKAASDAYKTAGFRPNRHNACVLKQKQTIIDRVSELLTERDRQHAKATEKAVEKVAIDGRFNRRSLSGPRRGDRRSAPSNCSARSSACLSTARTLRRGWSK